MSEPAQPFNRVAMFAGVTPGALPRVNAWLQLPTTRDFMTRPTRLEAGATAYAAMGGRLTYRAAASDADPEFSPGLASPQDDLTFALAENPEVPDDAVWLLRQVPPVPQEEA
jgi:hypothetical protein